MNKNRQKKHLYIITGYSGSGKTTALRYIEELGFYCVDNLPAEMLSSFTKLLSGKKGIDKIAVVIDARGKEFMTTLSRDLTRLSSKYELRIIFLDATLKSIINRFKESRLKHPLSLSGTVREGYQIEKPLLNNLRQSANLIINTSLINVHALKSVMQKYLLRDQDKIFGIHLMSFGFKFGPPTEADIVIDVRFLNNPHFHPKLKNKNGKNLQVQNFIKKDPQTEIFLKKTKSYLDYLLKQYKKEGKTYITIAFGCTGGKHRSIAVTEWMGAFFNQKPKTQAKIYHRDLGKS